MRNKQEKPPKALCASTFSRFPVGIATCLSYQRFQPLFFLYRNTSKSFEKANFTEVTLRRVTFKGVDLKSANFEKSKLGVEPNEYREALQFFYQKFKLSSAVSFIDTGLNRADMEKTASIVEDVSFSD